VCLKHFTLDQLWKFNRDTLDIAYQALKTLGPSIVHLHKAAKQKPPTDFIVRISKEIEEFEQFFAELKPPRETGNEMTKAGITSRSIPDATTKSLTGGNFHF
jgi:hypothetical protein